MRWTRTAAAAALAVTAGGVRIETAGFGAAGRAAHDRPLPGRGGAAGRGDQRHGSRGAGADALPVVVADLAMRSGAGGRKHPRCSADFVCAHGRDRTRTAVSAAAESGHLHLRASAPRHGGADPGAGLHDGGAAVRARRVRAARRNVGSRRAGRRGDAGPKRRRRRERGVAGGGRVARRGASADRGAGERVGRTGPAAQRGCPPDGGVDVPPCPLVHRPSAVGGGSGGRDDPARGRAERRRRVGDRAARHGGPRRPLACRGPRRLARRAAGQLRGTGRIALGRADVHLARTGPDRGHGGVPGLRGRARAGEVPFTAAYADLLSRRTTAGSRSPGACSPTACRRRVGRARGSARW